MPSEGTVELHGVRAILKKPKSDKTPYKDLYVEASRRDEQKDLAAAAKGPEVRGLNTEECNPFGYMSMDEMASRALNLDVPVQVDVAALGEKKCPYVTDFVSVGVIAHPNGGLLCLDGVVGVYSAGPHGAPQAEAGAGREAGTPQELGIKGLTIDINTMTAARFQHGAAYRRENGVLVLTGLGQTARRPVRVTRKRKDFIYKMPTELNYDRRRRSRTCRRPRWPRWSRTRSSTTRSPRRRPPGRRSGARGRAEGDATPTDIHR